MVTFFRVSMLHAARGYKDSFLLAMAARGVACLLCLLLYWYTSGANSRLVGSNWPYHRQPAGEPAWVATSDHSHSHKGRDGRRQTPAGACRGSIAVWALVGVPQQFIPGMGHSQQLFSARNALEAEGLMLCSRSVCLFSVHVEQDTGSLQARLTRGGHSWSGQ